MTAALSRSSGPTDLRFAASVLDALVGAARAVLACDCDGHIQLCTPRARRLLGAVADADSDQIDAHLVDRSRHPGAADRGPLAAALAGVSSPPLEVSLEVPGEGPTELVICAVPLRSRAGERLGAMLTLCESHADAADVAPVLGLHDPLTGLPNRRLLADRLEQCLARSSRSGTGFAVVMLDLDGFKQINDEYGHDSGDQLLREISSRLSGVVRPSDTVARIGGDELVVVVEGATSRADMDHLAGRLLDSITAPIRIRGREMTVGASLGVVFSGAETSAEQVLRRADLAMYEAKRRGRGRWAYFDTELEHTVARTARLTSELRHAITAGELEVAYQPEVDLRTRRLVGVEALVRWYHPEFGMVPPSELIQLAEHAQLVALVGGLVLDQACAQAARWRAEGHHRLMSVNLSARELAAPGLADRVLETLARHGLAGDALCLELAETSLMTSEVQSDGTLSRLREAGVRLAIDDFGTGFASLTYLQQLPIQAVKLDRSFIRGLPASRQDDAIVAGVLALAHTLDLTVVAEGVETAEQDVHLRSLGCDVGQGYFFGRPQPAEEIDAPQGAPARPGPG